MTKRIFSNRVVFLVITVLAAVSGTAVGVSCFLTNEFTDIFLPVMAALIVLLYIAYTRHNKNLMKALLGAVLAWAFSEEVAFTGKVLSVWKAEFQVLYGTTYAKFGMIRVMGVLVTLMLLILHFLINSDRLCRPMEVKVNRLLTCLLVLIYAEDILLTGLVAHIMTLHTWLVLIFKVLAILGVLWVEARLDESRQLREQQGWTAPPVTATKPGGVLIAVTALSLVSGTATLVLSFIQEAFPIVIVPALMGMSLWLLIAYCRHQKNLMKALMGAILLCLLYEEARHCVSLMASGSEMHTLFGTLFPSYAILKLSGVVLFFAVFCIHLYLNSHHHSKPIVTKVSQSCLYGLTLLYLAEPVLKAGMGVKLGIEYGFGIFKLSLVALVVLLEARLDRYRIRREAKEAEHS